MMPIPLTNLRALLHPLPLLVPRSLSLHISLVLLRTLSRPCL